MAIDAIQGANPFFNPLQNIDVNESQRGKRAKKAHQTEGKIGGPPPDSEGWGFSALALNKKDNTSFLKEGALGPKDALYVKGGRAGCCTNFIA